MDYDPLYVEFLYYFNIDRDFFECHEVMEELWLEEGRSLLYQGLLQVAVGLHHFSYGNASGSAKLFAFGIEKLKPYRNSHQSQQLGIDLDRLIEDAELYVTRLQRIDQQPLEFYLFNILITDPELQAKVDELRDHPPAKHDEH